MKSQVKRTSSSFSMKNFKSSKRAVLGSLLTLFLLHQVVAQAKLSNLGNVFLSQFESPNSNEAELNQESSSRSQQDGSWSQWWSYDGISGPDYWNINKHWNLCTSGRKQSPIDIRTERLVFDHLLGPIQLNWISFDQANNVVADLQPLSSEESQKSLKVQLLNSGRGIEAWLEPANAVPIETNSEFIISHGPLSYAYKLFKIELHSAANFASHRKSSPNSGGVSYAGRHAHGLRKAAERVNEPENPDLLAEEQVPEVLKSEKSSEHLIDGDSFEAELQLHFYNRHLASTSAQALQLSHESRPNLFATISVFIVASTVDSIDKDTGMIINDEKRREQQLASKRNFSSPIDFILDNLNVIPNQDRKQYITYQGSMNRPPCAENVDWILLNKAIKVDELKLGLLFEKLTTNQENIRPVKALNRRLLRTTISKLEFSIEDTKQSDSECGSNKQTRNCTNPIHKLTDASRSKQSEIRSKQSWCSMKPNYAYQFSYSQQSAKTVS